MNYINFLHAGTTARSMSNSDRELKQYAENEGLNWYILKRKAKKKKK